MIITQNVDEIIEAMIDNLGESVDSSFYKSAEDKEAAGIGPCTFCGKFGHTVEECPEMKKQKEKKNKTAEVKNQIIGKLTSVADTLDKHGFVNLANIIDEAITKVAQKE